MNEGDRLKRVLVLCLVVLMMVLSRVMRKLVCRLWLNEVSRQ